MALEVPRETLRIRHHTPIVGARPECSRSSGPEEGHVRTFWRALPAASCWWIAGLCPGLKLG
eukprot:7538461-Alexandrium_andersonii.AAC.1